MKNLKISIVIPAYNEESHIGSCLRAISKLDSKPYEVIVVDNNSTDNTVLIAEQFPFVQLIHEDKQGVVHARDLGFNSAKGDVIARIDADTHLPSSWTLQLDDIFDDLSVQAVSGSFHFYDVGFSRIVDSVETYLRGWMARRMSRSGRIFLNASNMAIRRSAWKKVRNEVCRERGIHEDLDLALHLFNNNKKVIYESSLEANVSARRVDSSFLAILIYASISPRTYIKHRASEHIYMYPEIALVLLLFPILRLLFRAYSKEDQKISYRQLLLRQTATRVNPAEFM